MSLTRILAAACLSLAVSVSVGPSFAQEPGIRPQVPIVIEADPIWDACGSNGVVYNLDPRGDGFLAVRSGPGTSYREIDRLYNGEQVYVCNTRGKWYGIVYSDQYSDCNVNTSWVVTQPYTGPCRSGWVHRNWIRIWAG